MPEVPAAAAIPSGRSLLWDAARETRGRLTLLAVLMLVRSATALAAPALLAVAVNGVLHGSSDPGPATRWAAVVTLGALCETVMMPLGASGAARGARRLRMRLARHLIGLGARQPQPHGESVTQITQAAAQAGMLPMALAQSAVTLTGSLAALAWLWTTDWRSALAFSLAAPITVVIARRFIGRVTRTHSAYLAAQAEIANRLLAALSGARTIRASDTLDAERARVLRPLPDLSAAGWRMWRLQRGTVWQFGLLLSLTEALVLAVAGLGVTQGRLSAAQLLAVTGYLQLAFQALQQIDTQLMLAQASAAARRLAAALATPPQAYGQGKAAAPTAAQGALSLRKVTVRRDDEVLLDGIDLDIPAGVSAALVGRTASGKSLLAGLPGRLTEPDEGDVLLDGVRVRELTAAELRHAVAYAFEGPELIGTTLHDTIAYGRPDTSRAAVERAAQVARADGFIRRLPDGYDTPLASAPMSGGERQRVGLARTLTRDALVYVLDDATSGLDTVTEAEVSAAVTSALAGRTRLVVAHRVTTAARCDLVVWLADGRVRAVAPHTELWPDPAYRAVFAIAEEDPS
ncbi:MULTISPECIES: ABC transporter ATP-binding protein [Streptomyces]|uniref:ABC transporter ATP-binding protein n=1 Tax=Streptomyces lonegramiae TaxID=3075524 RepID=A0ABU2XMD6_9ACTN|nr:ABC transporter ATP-binding protein [Streptomyces sp. DSM 41529]MDT0547051.1 ABC transporter ATP-binding protein [Streptomyces sp. DSM 41529]